MALSNDERMILGEIRANVRTLLDRDKATGERITFLERKYWIAVGIGGAALLLLGKAEIATAFAHVFVG